MRTRGADLPDPEWWGPAQRLRVEGATYKFIASVFSKQVNAVRYAVNEEYRKWFNEYNKRFTRSKERAKKDKKRSLAREIARERWRADGRKRALKWYYRDLDCL